MRAVQQRRINIHCVQKFGSAGHEGGGQRAAAAPRIDPFPFLRDSHSRRSATTAACLPIWKRARVLWGATAGRSATDEDSCTVATFTVCPSAVTFCSLLARLTRCREIKHGAGGFTQSAARRVWRVRARSDPREGPTGIAAVDAVTWSGSANTTQVR